MGKSKWKLENIAIKLKSLPFSIEKGTVMLIFKDWE